MLNKFRSVIALLCHTKGGKMGSCEDLGSAEPSKQGDPNKHPSSTKFMNSGLCRAQVVEKS